MELESILKFFENKTILVTGATGFLAKVFIEKILRVQPNVKKLYLLIRAVDVDSATTRLQNEVLGKDLFKVLRDLRGSDFDSICSRKLVPVPGDVSFKELGIKDSNLRENMWREINIIFNSAATTTFDERYDMAFGVNTIGAMNVLDFAKNCTKLEVFLHVSTAYVCGVREGLILESPLYQRDGVKGEPLLDINTEKNVIDGCLAELEAQMATKETTSSTMKDLGTSRARLHGWPNTYVFTKAMGEMVIEQFKGEFPLIICRPSMVTSTYKEPFPGYIEGARTIDGVIMAYGKGKLECFPAKPGAIYDVIPVDMVINSAIIAIVAHTSQFSETIYHVTSSKKNPLDFATVSKCGIQYFDEKPLLDRTGKPIPPSNTRKVVETIPGFHRYMAIHYGLPLKGLFLVNMILCQWYKAKYTNLNRKYKLALRLVDLYGPYIFFKGIFDDTNSEKLRMEAGENPGDLFNFDPMSINWEDYLKSTHIPGLVKYVVK